MTWQKTITPGETVRLKLSAAERKLIVDCLYVMDSRLQERVRQAGRNEDVPFTLDELQDLHGNLAFDANHTDDKKYERALDKILRNIDRILSFYCEAQQVDENAPQLHPKLSTVPMICGSSEVPAEFRQEYLEIVALTDEFCNERLNLEYQDLCREMAITICQEGSPVVRGKRASWASGIVYSVGCINFLGDPSQQPHIRSEEIAKWFGVSTATMFSKAKTIREGLDLVPLDPAFTLSSRLDDARSSGCSNSKMASSSTFGMRHAKHK